MQLDPSTLDYRDAYKLLIGTVLPRPVSFVSTLSADGVPNLSPFAFYNIVSAQPPIVIVSVGRRPDGRRKDTAANALTTGELVINVTTEDLIEPASLAAADWPSEADEFALAGLTPLPSVLVRPARVAESPINMECRLERYVTLGEGRAAHDVLFAQILLFHIRDDLYQDGRIDTLRLRPIGRLAGDIYVRVRDPFPVARPPADPARLAAASDSEPAPDPTASR
jgi:flavin reductase (DIM6/NTAB) family NADH-FMN oxidoreductase RutF